MSLSGWGRGDSWKGAGSRELRECLGKLNPLPTLQTSNSNLPADHHGVPLPSCGHTDSKAEVSVPQGCSKCLGDEDPPQARFSLTAVSPGEFTVSQPLAEPSKTGNQSRRMECTQPQAGSLENRGLSTALTRCVSRTKWIMSLSLRALFIK